MKEGILWLAVTPTPYNNFLFDCIWDRWPGSLRVLFSAPGLPDGTWDVPQPLPPWWGGYYGAGMPKLKAVRDAIASGASLTVVAGWNDWTRRFSLIGLFLLRKRYAIWTDTPHCTATVRHKLRNLVVRFLASRAVAVMGTGITGVNALRTMGIPAHKIMNFPYWVPLPRGVMPGRKSANATRFCCVGRLVRRKNSASAICALALIPDHSVRLDIIGSGPELEALQQVTRKEGVEGRVRFLGFLDHIEVARYLRDEGDCLIHPADGLEPFGVVIAEAMAYGLPVIASELCGAAVDRIHDGENGFLLSSPVEAEPLAERMKMFATCPEKIAIMGAAARRTAEQWPVERGVQILMDLAFDPSGQRLADGGLPSQIEGSAGGGADREEKVCAR
jgi:glycosyltransferase involved in cell wall biosynthesis